MMSCSSFNRKVMYKESSNYSNFQATGRWTRSAARPLARGQLLVARIVPSAECRWNELENGMPYWTDDVCLVEMSMENGARDAQNTSFERYNNGRHIESQRRSYIVCAT